MHRPIFPQILHNGRRMVFSQCQRRTVATSGACGGCHARSQQMRRGGKKVRTLPRVHHGWSGCTEGRRVGREREGSEGHPLIPSLTHSEVLCMHGGWRGKFHRLSVRPSVGWRDGEPVAKIEYVRTGRANTRPA